MLFKKNKISLNRKLVKKWYPKLKAVSYEHSKEP